MVNFVAVNRGFVVAQRLVGSELDVGVEHRETVDAAGP